MYSRGRWFWPIAALGVLVVVCGCGDSGKGEYHTEVIVTSQPEDGAQVLVNGTSYGETPVTIEGIRPGSAYVEVTKEGYKSAGREIRIPEKGAVQLEFVLRPVVGFLTIESKPPMATVVLRSGKVLGTTPIINRPVPVGKCIYEIRKENYEAAQKTLTVQEDYRYAFVHELTPKRAWLAVFSRPAGARIWLNDQPQEKTTPAMFDLGPGTYTVTVHAKGYVMSEKTVELGPNERLSVDLSLKEGDAPPGMVLVPAGELIWGVDGVSPDERPQRKVFVDAFYIDKYEVTNAEFKGAYPAHTYDKGRDRFPVAGVSWDQAVEYAKAVGKRLPTEMEWEKAARGDDGREFPWGDMFSPGLCNSAARFPRGVQEVGRYRGGTSPYGCMDMAGNVYEWTSSWYAAYPGNTEIRTEYGQIFRVLRGGSYLSDRFHLRCAKRHYDRMDTARADYGFRCVMDVTDIESPQNAR